MDGSKRKSDDEFTRMAWRLSGMGLEFISGVVGFGVVGWLIDRWTGSTPTWTITGIVLGVVGSSYNFMRQAIKAGRLAQKEFDRSHPRARDDHASADRASGLGDQPAVSDELHFNIDDEFEDDIENTNE
jgi:F0F1-type ATP synthase assembly protein I